MSDLFNRVAVEEPRFELAPLLDVIFLLLTFFLFSQVLMTRVEILPVSLPKFSESTTVETAEVLALTVDAAGALHLNREPVTEAALAEQLKAAGERSPQPRVYLAVDAKMGQIDRAPVMMRIMSMINAAGLKDVAFVGAWSSTRTDG